MLNMNIYSKRSKRVTKHLCINDTVGWLHNWSMLVQICFYFMCFKQPFSTKWFSGTASWWKQTEARPYIVPRRPQLAPESPSPGQHHRWVSHEMNAPHLAPLVTSDQPPIGPGSSAGDKINGYLRLTLSGPPISSHRLITNLSQPDLRNTCPELKSSKKFLFHLSF